MPFRTKDDNIFYPRLKDALIGTIAGELPAAKLQFLLHASHALATELLRLKLYSHPGLRKHLGLSDTDLAYDCIGELFERDSTGSLIHFKTYFSSFDVGTFSDEQFVLHFRRLISSAVNQNLFRVYSDFDRALGKIIRNIKLSVAAHKTFEEIDRFDTPCLAPVHCDRLEHLPTIAQDELLTKLLPAIRGKEFVPELLSIASRCLREQQEFSRIVPLVTLALVFRTIYVLKNEPAPQSTNEQAAITELRDMIQMITEEVQHSVTVRFTEGNHLFCHYFDAIKDLLLAKIDLRSESPESLYKGLLQRIPTLTQEEYREVHRTRLEYFYKMCREALAAELIEHNGRR
jgi:hypothetical protein